MAATRPVVLVFQEFATLSSSPATPELNCLVAGPAYWLQDFPDDRANIKWGLTGATDYGAAGAVATGAAVITTSVTRADAPNNKVGAIIDQASVRVFTSETQVELAVGSDMTTTPLDPTVGSAAVDFVAAGVQLLDTVVITDPAAPTVALTRTIVGPVSAAGVFNGTNTLTLSSEIPAGFAAVANKFRIERTLPESEIDASFYTFVPATNSITVNALATLPIGVDQKRLVSCELFVAYRSLRTDLQDVTTLNSVNEITGQLGRIDARNPLAVGLSVALQNTNTTVQYFGVGTDDITGYTAMKNAIGGRKDIYAVVPLSSDILVLQMLNVEFTNLADPDYALTNGVPQKFRVAVGSSAALPTTKIIVDVQTPASLLAATAGGTEINVAQAASTTYHTLNFSSLSLIASNVQPGDLLTLAGDTTAPGRASGTLTLDSNAADGATVTTGTKTYTFKAVLANVNGYVLIGATASDSIDNLTAAISLGAGSGTAYAAATSANGFVSAVVGVGDTMDVAALIAGVTGNSIVTADNNVAMSWGATTLTLGVGADRSGTYTVAQVLSATSLEVDAEVLGGAQSATATVLIQIGTTGGSRVPLTGVIPVDTTLDAKRFIDLYDADGTFIDSGVIPTDLVEMPMNPNQSSFTEKHTYQVASIVSNQRLRIVDNGRSTSLVANELPHGVSRNSPATLIPVTQTLQYRITRTLDKAGQVTAIIAVAQSLNSRRVVNVWPDLCDVGGLVDGSLPRDPAAPTVSQPAASQPGYYLACAVGGMTAGLPSHQGFSNLGIAAISKIYNANTYFSDKNITDISNGGWFVFQQDTPQALPYVVHQLTTDVTTLQSGEFSMVKNFDFVSLFFADILDAYLGIWNINPETMGFVSTSVAGGVDNLKLRRRPRIGAPIINGRLTSIFVSPTSADRLEMYVECQFPAPLNVIALHLVSA